MPIARSYLQMTKEEKFLKNVWMKLLRVGASAEQASPLAQKIYKTNELAVILSACAFFIGTCLLLLKAPYMGLLAIGISISFALVMVANSLKCHTLSRILLLSILNLAIYIFSTSFGRDSGTHFWFLTAALIPIAIFNLNERHFMFGGFGIGALMLLFVWFTKFQFNVLPLVIMDANSLSIISLIMISLNFLTTFSIMFYFSIELNKTIDDLHMNEKKLDEDHLRALNESSIVAHTDRAGLITYVNDKFCEISGYQRAELIGKSHAIINSGQHSPEFMKELWETISSNKIWKGEICNRAKNGSLYWVKTTILPYTDATNKIEKYVAIRQDITKKKNYEIELGKAHEQTALSEQSFRAFFDNAAVGVVKLDSKFRYLSVNSAFCKFMEYSQEELLKLSTKDVTHPDDVTNTITGISHSVANDISLMRFEKRNITKSGKVIWVLISGRSIKINNGEDYEIYAIIEDITVQKENEKIILDQQVGLIKSSKMSVLGEMAAGVAHEINNPLTIMLGKIRSLKRQLKSEDYSSEKTIEGLTKIEEMTFRIARIVKGLTLFSRNADTDAMISVSASGIIEDSLSLCAERFKAQSIEVIIKIDRDIMLECRPTEIAQILVNLFGNAHDAILHLKEKWILVELAADNSRVKIIVTDSGSGLAVAVSDKMMDPFFTTKELGKGTGLGLSISKGLAVSHSGNLWYNQTAKNTSFVLDLPMKQFY